MERVLEDHPGHRAEVGGGGEAEAVHARLDGDAHLHLARAVEGPGGEVELREGTVVRRCVAEDDHAGEGAVEPDHGVRGWRAERLEHEEPLLGHDGGGDRRRHGTVAAPRLRGAPAAPAREERRCRRRQPSGYCPGMSRHLAVLSVLALACRLLGIACGLDTVQILD